AGTLPLPAAGGRMAGPRDRGPLLRLAWDGCGRGAAAHDRAGLRANARGFGRDRLPARRARPPERRAPAATAAHLRPIPAASPTAGGPPPQARANAPPRR